MEFVPVQLVDRKIAAKLDISDLDIPELNGKDLDNEERERIDDLLVFQMSSYDKLNRLNKIKNLRGSNYEEWNHAFAAVNRFLSLVDHGTKCEITYALVLMHMDIRAFFADQESTDTSVLTRKLSEKCDKLDQACDLCGKLRDYVIKYIPIGLMPNAGKRPQDSARLTFYPEEVTTLMSITLLCKLMSPIFGVMIHNLIPLIDIKAKEACCVAIFTDLFNRRFSELINKLKYYIRHTVNVQCKEDTTRTLMHGYDNFTLSHTMYCQLLIRQFVNVPLIRKGKEGNLITYVLVSVKKAISTIQSAILNKPTYSRPLFISESDDDGNTSRLEVDSIATKRTCDVPMLVKCAVPHTINKYLDLYEIDREQYDDSVRYYLNNPIVPTKLNKDVNSMFYSRDFGGGKGILMLKAMEYSQITALLQLILFHLAADDGYRQLAHMMTVLPSIDSQLGFTFEDNLFKMNVGSSVGYRNCRMRFENSPFGLKGREWDNHIKDLTTDLIMNKYRYNTANWIWNWMEMDNLNGKLVKPDGCIISALCDFYDWLHGVKA